MAFSADGKTLAMGLWFGQPGMDCIRLWDTATWKELASYRGHAKFVAAINYRPDGRVLITASNDGTVKLWPVSRPAAVMVGKK